MEPTPQPIIAPLGPGPSVAPEPPGLMALLRVWLAGPLGQHGPIALLLVVSAVLRAFRLGEIPGQLIGDEVWYVQDARVLLGLPVMMSHLPATAMSGLDPNSEHPPLAKLIMALCMRLWGDREIAWRIPSVVLGTLSIWLLFRIILALGGSRAQAFFGAFVLAFDNLSFIHGRIAMLDIYLVAFILLGTWLYLSSYLELAAIAFALATLCKLNGMLGLGAMLLYDVILARERWRTPSWPALRRRAWVVLLFAGFLLLGLGALDCFFTEFRSPIDHLVHMVQYHAGLRHSDAASSSGTESVPPQWWLDQGTMDYFVWNITADGLSKHVLFRAQLNQYLIFAAPLALLFATIRAWREKSQLGAFAIASLIANFGPVFMAWVIVSRVSYIYYMVPSVPAIACAIALVAYLVPASMRWGFAVAMLYAFFYAWPFHYSSA